MSAPDVRIGVLGPTTIEVDGENADLGSLKQRALLAVLAMGGGRPVTVDRIVDALWGDSPPPGVTTTLHGYIASLRRLLEPRRAPRTPPSVLVTAPGGYALRLTDRGLDAAQFADVVAQSAAQLRRVPDHLRPVAEPADVPAVRAAHDQLEAAIADWRGLPYADLGDVELAEPERQRLHELLLTARSQQAVAQLALGEHAAATAALERLTAEHPLREQLWALRAVALTRGGRQAEALDVLQQLRDVLADELGLDPSPAVQQLQGDILRQDESLLVVAPSGPTSASVPRFGWPLVGRERELALFDPTLERAAGGWTQLGLVVGEAGIGKSRLLRELAVRASERGFLHVEGRCSSDDGAPPLWAWRQVLRSLEASCGIEVPDLDSWAEQSDADGRAAQFALSEAIVAALHAAADVVPLLIVVEDVHWADASTIRVLRHLADHGGRQRLLLCVTQRPEHPEHVAELGYAFARADAVRVDLSGLDAEESARLVEVVGGVDAGLADGQRLQARTGGNPFFLSEIAQSGDPLGDALPTTLIEVVGQRVRTLPDATRDVLAAAAVVDRIFDPDLVATAAGLPPAVLRERLEPARAAGLVVDDLDGRLAFAHALVRDALTQSTRPAVREAWHARVARALEQRGGGTSEHTEIAFHWRAAGYAHAARAWRAAIAAAATAREVFASEEEADLLAQAIESQSLDVLSTDRERYDLLMLRAAACRTSADWDGAASAVTLAIATAERLGDPELAARASVASVEGAVWHARTYGTVLDDLVAGLRRALDNMPTEDSELRCRVMLSLAAEAYYSTPREETDALVDEALAIAERIGDRRLLVVAHQLGFSGRWRPETAEWRLGAARRAYELSVELEDVPLEVTSRAFLAIVLVELGRVDEARGLIEPTIELARDHGILTVVTILELLHGPLLQLSGRDAEADASLARILGLAERVTVPNMGHAAAALASTSALWQGRHDELMTSLSELISQRTVPVDSFVIVLLLRVGAEGLARQMFEVRPVDFDDHDYMGMIQICLAAEIAATLGAPELGARAYDWLTPYAGRMCSAGSTTLMGPVDAFLALAAFSTGELEAASRHADDAAALCRAWGLVRVTEWFDGVRERLGF